MTDWVDTKNIDGEHISSLLSESIKTGNFTNYGPLVKMLECELTNIMSISDENCVVVTNNGANALHALVNALNLYSCKNLKFTTQDFTFPSALQCVLKNSDVVDVDNDMQFDLNGVNSDTDGLLVTNLFGHCCDIDKYVKYCKDKFLIFDNATCPLTYYNGKNINNYGDGCIISLHHTKPLGFGEGGAIICSKKYEESVRRIINFGYQNTVPRIWHPYGGNYKMSDISAAYCISYLRNTDEIEKHYISIYDFFMYETKDIKIKHFPTKSDKTSLVSCIPFFVEKNRNKILNELNSEGIKACKYYPPLTGLPMSVNKFNNIICLPLHRGVNKEIINTCIEIIKKYI